ncbi:hypothetical protein [Microtetraspora sp. NBRC 13810]|nr:hypothetical protein [Microtetraspora sp. NBRC 13810]
MRDDHPLDWADAVDFDERISHGHPGAGTLLDGQAYLHRSRRKTS